MAYKFTNRLTSSVFEQGDKFKFVSLFFIIGLMIGEYLLVYFTGGTQFSYLHTMYIPILLAGIIFGFRGGLFFGMLAGIILGPLMPIDTATGEAQAFANWFFRFSLFTIIGSLAGFFSSGFREQSKNLVYFMTTHRFSGIKLAIFDRSKTGIGVNWDLDEKDSILAICLMNFDMLVDLLGKEEYYNVFRDGYNKLTSLSPTEDSVLQYDIRSYVMYVKGSDGKELADKIVEVLSDSFMVNGTPLYLQANIGISKFHGDIEETIYRALSASRQAELTHLDYSVFDNTQENKQSDFEILGSFFVDFKNDKTRLVYHPIIDLKTNKVVYLEALSRWENKIRGEISPSYFIPLVEETQIINELTRWVFDTVVIFLKQLKSNGIDIAISINISANNLMSTKLVDYIIKQAGINDIDNSMIVFEITETALMNNPKRSLEVINKFKEIGFSISLDDYGTGYSSLSYLSNFPLDKVKIDKAFIKDIKDNKKVYDIVESSIKMSHKLGFLTVAEGVEDLETEKILREMNCDYVQGFLYAKPIEEDKYEEWHKLRNSK